MTPAEVVGSIQIQNCGCVAIPEELASALEMLPGTTAKMLVDVEARSITLTAPAGNRVGAIPALEACLIGTPGADAVKS